jgi:hypothetical protein
MWTIGVRFLAESGYLFLEAISVWFPHSLLLNVYLTFFAMDKVAGLEADHSPQFNDEFENPWRA